MKTSFEGIAMVKLKSELNKVKAVTWGIVKQATQKEYSDLLNLIEAGFNVDKQYQSIHNM